MPRILPLFTLSLPLLLTACGSPSASFSGPRQVSKEQRPTTWDAPDARRLRISEVGAQQPQQPKAGKKYTATVPAGWEAQPAQPARFRDLVWRVAGDASTECYLTAFVGGGLEANVARWYGQFGAPVADHTKLPKCELAGESAYLLELSGNYQGKAGQGMLLAFLGREGGVTTLKFTGPEATVKAQREAFLALAKSLRAEGAPAGKDAGAAPAAPAAPASGEPPSGYTSTLPAGWEVLPPQPQRFRDLIWRVPGEAPVECYLTAFVGGGVDGNVARWYGQMGADPKPASSLPAIEMAGEQGKLLELTGSFAGKAGMAMLVAFVARGDGVTTLKFTGPEAVVKAQRDAFLGLARSLRPAGGAAPAATVTKPETAPSATPPAGHGAEAAAPFTATVPAGWTPKAGTTKLLHHTFGGDGEVYLSQLGGDLRAMLDVWRGEVGLTAATDAEFAAVGKLPMLGGEGVLLDVAGDWKSTIGKQIAGARLLVGAYKDGTAIVFVKLVGSAADVAAQVDGFKAFCASLRRNS